MVAMSLTAKSGPARAKARGSASWTQDPKGVRRSVLEVARAEFVEEAHARIRAFERSLDLAALPPREAIATLTAFTFDYHADNPDFARLVMVENIHHARHLATSSKIGALNLSAIDMIREIHARGLAQGVFREGLDPIDIHLTISALNVSNKASIRQVFGHGMAAPGARERRCRSAVDTGLRMICR
jgi:hypothetical protein